MTARKIFTPLSAVLTALLLAAVSGLASAQQIVQDAAAAMGGSARILAVKSLIIEGSGTQYNLGQDLVPGASGETFTVTGYKRIIDFTGGRARTELTRKPNFTYFQGPVPQKQINGLDGSIGYNVAANGTSTRVALPVVKERLAELLQHPLNALRAALDPKAMLSNPRTQDKQSLIDVKTPDGQTFTLSVDSATKLPSQVSTLADNTVLGDVAVSTQFSGYQNAGGLKLPTRLISKTGDFTTAVMQVTNQSIDADTGDLAAPTIAPATAAAPATPAPPPPQAVVVEEVGHGIWFLSGGSHHSVLVEFKDHLLLIEAPLNDARALAVIAKARELRPGKPLTHVVNTHHHFDHSGGIRAAISEDLTIITHQANAAFYADIAQRTHTLVLDALARNPKPLKIETVNSDQVITDGTMTVNLYPIVSEHSRSMLVAYFPGERLLVEADLYTPGNAIQMFAGRFLEDLKQRNLNIDRIVPLHGKIAPYEQFVKEATAVPGTN